MLLSKRSLLSLGTLLFAVAAPARNSSHTRLYTIEQLKKTVQVSGPRFSSDGTRVLFSSNENGIWNVRSVSARGGASVPITSSQRESTFAVSYFPHDDRVLYTRDDSGDENSHIFVHGIKEDIDVTPGAAVRASFKGWDATGDGFFFISNARDAKFFDVYRLDARTLTSILLYRNEGEYEISRISPDSRWIAMTKSTPDGNSLFVCNRASGEVRQVTAGKGGSEPQFFDRQSHHLYFITDERSDRSRLARIDLLTGTGEDVEAPAGDVTFASVSSDGRFRAVGIGTNGRTDIEITDTAGNERVPIPGLPAGNIDEVRFSMDARKIVFTADDDRSPSNIYVFDLTKRALKRVTNARNPEVRESDLVEGVDVRFTSFDSLPIPAILFRPYEAKTAKKLPAVIWVHGGPGGQYKHGYFSIIQYLTNHGYAVLGVNNRGSSGYGKAFEAADDGRHGREPLWDCVAAKHYLESLPFIDGERIAIAGESYGGYMALAALAFQPQVFRAGVDFYGVANWVRTLESIPPYWEGERRRLYAEIGDPVQDRQKLEAISPLFHTDAIERPLLVVQGANDRRTLRVESDQIVAALQKKGVPVTYLLFEGEGHGLTKRANQVNAFQGTLDFLDRYVKGWPEKPPHREGTNQ